VAYERKKLVNKLKAKVEKIVDKKLGSQFEVGVYVCHLIYVEYLLYF
jgi:hypothetical protein